MAQARETLDAVGRITEASEALIRNPNEALLLQAMLLGLPAGSVAA